MVLVTGGAGLVGNELINQLLAKGKQVRAIYNKNLPAIKDQSLQVVQCSINDVSGLEDVMEGVDEVFHCAALVSFSSKDAGALYKVNVEGAANVVNIALDYGIKKLVHVSSVAAIGRPVNNKSLISESSVWQENKHTSNYAKSKFLGEMEVWRGIAEGLNAVIVNPSIILGPGNWDDGSTAIFKSVYNSFPWYTEGMKGFVDVRDVARAMILLMESDISSERFIINAENHRFKDLFVKIASCFNSIPPKKKVTPLLASLVWRLESIKSMITGKKPLVTKETAASAFAIDIYDNSKLLSLFPSFSYSPIDITIADTCHSLQQKLNNR